MKRVVEGEVVDGVSTAEPVITRHDLSEYEGRVHVILATDGLLGSTNPYMKRIYKVGVLVSYLRFLGVVNQDFFREILTTSPTDDATSIYFTRGEPSEVQVNDFENMQTNELLEYVSKLQQTLESIYLMDYTPQAVLDKFTEKLHELEEIQNILGMRKEESLELDLLIQVTELRLEAATLHFNLTLQNLLDAISRGPESQMVVTKVLSTDPEINAIDWIGPRIPEQERIKEIQKKIEEISANELVLHEIQMRVSDIDQVMNKIDLAVSLRQQNNPDEYFIKALHYDASSFERFRGLKTEIADYMRESSAIVKANRKKALEEKIIQQELDDADFLRGFAERERQKKIDEKDFETDREGVIDALMDDAIKKLLPKMTLQGILDGIEELIDKKEELEQDEDKTWDENAKGVIVLDTMRRVHYKDKLPLNVLSSAYQDYGFSEPEDILTELRKFVNQRIESQRHELRTEESNEIHYRNLRRDNEVDEVETLIDLINGQSPLSPEEKSIFEYFAEKNILVQSEKGRVSIFNQESDLSVIAGLFVKPTGENKRIVENYYPDFFQNSDSYSVEVVAFDELGQGNNRFAYQITLSKNGIGFPFYGKVDKFESPKSKKESTSTMDEMRNYALLRERIGFDRDTPKLPFTTFLGNVEIGSSSNLKKEWTEFEKSLEGFTEEERDFFRPKSPKIEKRWVQYGQLIRGLDLERQIEKIIKEGIDDSNRSRLKFFAYALGEMVGDFYQRTGGWMFGDFKAPNVAIDFNPGDRPRLVNIDYEVLYVRTAMLAELQKQKTKQELSGVKDDFSNLELKDEFAHIPIKFFPIMFNKYGLEDIPKTNGKNDALSLTQITGLYLAGFLSQFEANNPLLSELEKILGVSFEGQDHRIAQTITDVANRFISGKQTYPNADLNTMNVTDVEILGSRLYEIPNVDLDHAIGYIEDERNELRNVSDGLFEKLMDQDFDDVQLRKSRSYTVSELMEEVLLEVDRIARNVRMSEGEIFVAAKKIRANKEDLYKDNEVEFEKLQAFFVKLNALRQNLSRYTTQEGSVSTVDRMKELVKTTYPDDVIAGDLLIALEEMKKSLSGLTDFQKKRTTSGIGYPLNLNLSLSDVLLLTNLSFELDLSMNDDGVWELNIGDLTHTSGKDLHTHPPYPEVVGGAGLADPAPSMSDIVLSGSNLSNVGLMIINNRRSQQGKLPSFTLKDEKDRNANENLNAIGREGENLARGKISVEDFSQFVNASERVKVFEAAGIEIRFVPITQLSNLVLNDDGSVTFTLTNDEQVTTYVQGRDVRSEMRSADEEIADIEKRIQSFKAFLDADNPGGIFTIAGEEINKEELEDAIRKGKTLVYDVQAGLSAKIKREAEKNQQKFKGLDLDKPFEFSRADKNLNNQSSKIAEDDLISFATEVTRILNSFDDKYPEDRPNERSISFVISELLKNAVYHGNQLDVRLPVAIKLTLDGDRVVQIDTFDLAEKESLEERFPHSEAHLSGNRNFKGMLLSTKNSHWKMNNENNEGGHPLVIPVQHPLKGVGQVTIFRDKYHPSEIDRVKDDKKSPAEAFDPTTIPEALSLDDGQEAKEVKRETLNMIEDILAAFAGPVIGTIIFANMPEVDDYVLKQYVIGFSYSIGALFGVLMRGLQKGEWKKFQRPNLMEAFVDLVVLGVVVSFALSGIGLVYFSFAGIFSLILVWLSVQAQEFYKKWSGQEISDKPIRTSRYLPDHDLNPRQAIFLTVFLWAIDSVTKYIAIFSDNVVFNWTGDISAGKIQWVATAFVATLVFGMFRRIHIGLVFAFAGLFGNFYDQYYLEGVVDFLPALSASPNIADWYLGVGVGLILLDTMIAINEGKSLSKYILRSNQDESLKEYFTLNPKNALMFTILGLILAFPYVAEKYVFLSQTRDKNPTVIIEPLTTGELSLINLEKLIQHIQLYESKRLTDGIDQAIYTVDVRNQYIKYIRDFKRSKAFIEEIEKRRNVDIEKTLPDFKKRLLTAEKISEYLNQDDVFKALRIEGRDEIVSEVLVLEILERWSREGFEKDLRRLENTALSANEVEDYFRLLEQRNRSVRSEIPPTNQLDFVYGFVQFLSDQQPKFEEIREAIRTYRSLPRNEVRESESLQGSGRNELRSQDKAVDLNTMIEEGRVRKIATKNLEKDGKILEARVIHFDRLSKLSTDEKKGMVEAALRLSNEIYRKAKRDMPEGYIREENWLDVFGLNPDTEVFDDGEEEMTFFLVTRALGEKDFSLSGFRHFWVLPDAKAEMYFIGTSVERGFHAGEFLNDSVFRYLHDIKKVKEARWQSTPEAVGFTLKYFSRKMGLHIEEVPRHLGAHYTLDLDRMFASENTKTNEWPDRFEMRTTDEKLVDDMVSFLVKDYTSGLKGGEVSEKDQYAIRKYITTYVRHLEAKDDEHKRFYAQNYFDGLRNDFYFSFRNFMAYIRELNRVVDMIEGEFLRFEAADSSDMIKSFISIQRDRTLRATIINENNRGSSSDESQDALGIASLKKIHQEILNGWRKGKALSPERYLENGKILFQIALRLALELQLSHHNFERSNFKTVSDLLAQTEIEFNGKKYERQKARLPDGGISDEFSEGKNIIFQMELRDAETGEVKKILAKVNVLRPEFDEIVTNVTKQFKSVGEMPEGLFTYHVEVQDPSLGQVVRVQDSDFYSRVQLIEFIPSDMVYFQQVENGFGFDSKKSSNSENLDLLLNKDKESRERAFKELGSHLAIEYLLGGRDSYMKHFLLSKDGHFFKIDHEYLFEFGDKPAHKKLPGTLERESDFWGMIEEIRSRLGDSETFDIEREIAKGFNSTLKAFLYNENGVREKVLEVISERLNFEKTKLSLTEIEREMELRARHSYDMLRGIAKSSYRSELRQRELTGAQKMERRAMITAMGSTLALAALGIVSLIYGSDEHRKMMEWSKKRREDFTKKYESVDFLNQPWQAFESGRNDVVRIRNLFTTIDWLILQGYPHPEVLDQYAWHLNQNAKLIKGELPFVANKTYDKKGEVEINISSYSIDKIYDEIATLKDEGKMNATVFVETLGSIIGREAWGLEAMRADYTGEQRLMKIDRSLTDELDSMRTRVMKPGELDVRKKKFGDVLLERKEDILSEVSRSVLVFEVYESLRQSELLKWAVKKGLYRNADSYHFMDIDYTKPEHRYRKDRSSLLLGSAKQSMYKVDSTSDIVFQIAYEADMHLGTLDPESVREILESKEGSYKHKIWLYWHALEAAKYLSSAGQEGFDPLTFEAMLKGLPLNGSHFYPQSKTIAPKILRHLEYLNSITASNDEDFSKSLLMIKSNLRSELRTNASLSGEESDWEDLIDFEADHDDALELVDETGSADTRDQTPATGDHGDFNINQPPVIGQDGEFEDDSHFKKEIRRLVNKEIWRTFAEQVLGDFEEEGLDSENLLDRFREMFSLEILVNYLKLTIDRIVDAAADDLSDNVDIEEVGQLEELVDDFLNDAQYDLDKEALRWESVIQLFSFFANYRRAAALLRLAAHTLNQELTMREIRPETLFTLYLISKDANKLLRENIKTDLDWIERSSDIFNTLDKEKTLDIFLNLDKQLKQMKSQLEGHFRNLKSLKFDAAMNNSIAKDIAEMESKRNEELEKEREEKGRELTPDEMIAFSARFIGAWINDLIDRKSYDSSLDLHANIPELDIADFNLQFYEEFDLLDFEKIQAKLQGLEADEDVSQQAVEDLMKIIKLQARGNEFDSESEARDRWQRLAARARFLIAKIKNRDDDTDSGFSDDGNVPTPNIPNFPNSPLAAVPLNSREEPSGGRVESLREILGSAEGEEGQAERSELRTNIQFLKTYIESINPNGIFEITGDLFTDEGLVSEQGQVKLRQAIKDRKALIIDVVSLISGSVKKLELEGFDSPLINNNRIESLAIKLRTLGVFLERILGESESEISTEAFGQWKTHAVIRELLKNSIYHGNRLNLNFPVALNFSFEGDRHTTIDVYDFGLETYRPQHSTVELSGTRKFTKMLLEETNYRFSDDVYSTSIKPFTVLNEGGVKINKVSVVRSELRSESTEGVNVEIKEIWKSLLNGVQTLKERGALEGYEFDEKDNADKKITLRWRDKNSRSDETYIATISLESDGINFYRDIEKEDVGFIGEGVSFILVKDGYVVQTFDTSKDRRAGKLASNLSKGFGPILNSEVKILDGKLTINLKEDVTFFSRIQRSVPPFIEFVVAPRSEMRSFSDENQPQKKYDTRLTKTEFLEQLKPVALEAIRFAMNDDLLSEADVDLEQIKVKSETVFNRQTYRSHREVVLKVKGVTTSFWVTTHEQFWNAARIPMLNAKLQQEAAVTQAAYDGGVGVARAKVIDVPGEPSFLIRSKAIGRPLSFEESNPLTNEILMIRIGEALARMHNLGIVHGDLFYGAIKWQHIYLVLDSEGNARVAFLDFDRGAMGDPLDLETQENIDAEKELTEALLNPEENPNLISKRSNQFRVSRDLDQKGRNEKIRQILLNSWNWFEQGYQSKRIQGDDQSGKRFELRTEETTLEPIQKEELSFETALGYATSLLSNEFFDALVRDRKIIYRGDAQASAEWMSQNSIDKVESTLVSAVFRALQESLQIEFKGSVWTDDTLAVRNAEMDFLLAQLARYQDHSYTLALAGSEDSAEQSPALKQILEALKRHKGRVNEMILNGKFDASYLERLKNEGDVEYLRSANLNRKMVTMNNQANVPLLILSSLLGSVNEIYTPFRNNISEDIREDSLALDYVELFRVVAAIHYAAIVTENPEILSDQTGEALKAELLSRLQRFGDSFEQILQKEGNGWTISASVARLYLESRIDEAMAASA